jgi:hypothetical protein
MDRQIDSPMPMPWDLVVKKRLENAVGVPWIDTATGVLHCNQKAARLVGLDGPMTEEPHGKTSIGTVGTRCAGGKRDEKDCHCLGLHHNSWAFRPRLSALNWTAIRIFGSCP